ncbi:hypothetical protein RJ639_011368 [Escallonia herrerae]|uniref:Calponin-homology (CH) domain-containing protein n=1 Tax=Escallonia herrerae TaxID=1293975 RepID=A0AA88VPQ1_9ASTE|nr:hypothetical protein RJ639_011368 [Escallonia herrerae]
MEAKHQQNQPCPSPSVFRDLSNFKTPKRPSQNPNFTATATPQFFTAAKRTPQSTTATTASTLRRPRRPLSSAARRLKAFELEQSRSARKAELRKRNSLNSLAKSLTVWLNFLFENPRSCGCDARGEEVRVLGSGKRESWEGGGVEGVGVGGGGWRIPKRRRDLWWREVEGSETASLGELSFPQLESSLKDVCGFEDLKERMRVYLTLGCCEEVFSVMTHVVKNIDEGRIKMKAHCPIVSDVGMKEKAMRSLLCYNSIWLRIGFYIIFGGESLLRTGDSNSEQEIAFLKMVVEKQFFTHSGLAKAFAYNKSVEGLYRPGYFEKLGNIVLKRFLLLVLILDRAKSQSSIPINYGIDGFDGGSPLLFTLQSNIKSSREVISDFLSSDVMHGEGNLLAHLVIIGYKVSYQQSPLIEYDFRITDLFRDLQDGVRLCRAIQLLQHDFSILMKMVIPSDTRKKNLVNCGIALQHLKQAGVPLDDEDGAVIIGEDIVDGEKELTISLLWNIFVHLQLPLLINKSLLCKEILKIRGPTMENLNRGSLLDMLLSWIQAICRNYDLRVDNFASLVDGKAMWCLLDYYFRIEHSGSSKKDADAENGEASIMSATDYTDAVHNFILSQKLTSLLGNFPEVLQVSDILEHNGACNERSVVILLVFLSFQLIVKRNTGQLNFHKLLGFGCQTRERKHAERWFVHSEAPGHQEETQDTMQNFKAIMAWWRDMAQANSKCEWKPITPKVQCFSTGKQNTTIKRENAVRLIQSNFRGSSKHCNYLQKRNAASLLQTVIRAWLTVKKKSGANSREFQKSSLGHWVQQADKWKESETFVRYMTFLVDRHDFVKLKQSAVVIQHAIRAWILRRHHTGTTLAEDMYTPELINATVVIQKCIRGWTTRSTYSHRDYHVEKDSIGHAENEVNYLQEKAASKIQLAWKQILVCKSLRIQHSAATKIQSYYRGWLLRKSFLKQKQAVIAIQSVFRCIRCWRDFKHYKLASRSAIIIQCHVRCWIAGRRATRKRCLIVIIQSHCRGWMTRKDILIKREAAIRIQSDFRCMKCWKAFHHYRNAVIEIQKLVRGQLSRKRRLGASCIQKVESKGYICGNSTVSFQSLELTVVINSVLMLQRWWRGILLLNLRIKSATVIQSHARRWIARQKATKAKHHIVVIQSFWKGYLARKDLKGQLLDLRLRVQKSATNVDEGMRIMNRLVAALSELLNMKSVSSILHTCATLDMATTHSQKCCEKLVAEGAVDKLLTLIRSVSRSIPDQEVLKHALSTLRNLARYPHLTEVLIDSRSSTQTILLEFLRNKEEGYFIASELLEKICLNERGVLAVRSSPALLKRLHSHVEDLTRKATKGNRNVRSLVKWEQTERRLRKAIKLLDLITNG